MNYINPNAPAAGLTRLLNMRDNNPATQLAYVPTRDIAAMGSMGGLEFNPYSGIPQARGIAAVADGGSIQDAPLAPVADELASRGRYGDSMLLHVRPDELQGLASLGTLTINPDTGLPEAFSFKSLLPAVGAIAGSIFLGPVFGGTALGVGLGAGLGSFAGGLAAGQGVGQAALGGLMSGATAGFMQGLAPTGFEQGVMPTPGAETLAPEAAGGMFGEGLSGAAGQSMQAASAASMGLPTTGMTVSEFGTLGAGVPITPNAIPTVTPVTTLPQSTIRSASAAGIKPGETFFTYTGETTKPGAISKFFGAEPLKTGDVLSKQAVIDKGFMPSDMTISERAGQVLTDPKTYVGAGISTMLQPPPPMEYQEPEPLELGSSYVPRERTLAGGVQSPARSSEEYLRMALEGGYQPLSEQYRYIAQGGLVGLVEGGTPEQGELQSQLSPAVQQPSAPPPVLQQQEQQISERARQDELLQRDQAMSRGQQFIEQPTGNQQLFQQMQNVGQVIGQQLAQGPESYATPPGQSAAPSSFVSGTSFGFNAGGLVGLAEGGVVSLRQGGEPDQIENVLPVTLQSTMKRLGIKDATPFLEFAQKTKQIESSGGVNRINPDSDARGDFQWLTKVDPKAKKGVHGSVKTAVNRTIASYKRMGQDIPQWLKTLDKNSTKSTKDLEANVLSLTPDQELELFFGNIGEAVGSDKYLTEIAKGNQQAMFEAYSDIHHTRGRKDKPTKDLAIKIFFSDMTKPDIDNPVPTTKDMYDDKSFSSVYSGMPTVQKETQMAKLSDTENDVGILSILRNILSGEDKQYEVQAGDTLSAIAKQQGMSLDELLEANKSISDPNVISRGQEITVPDQSSFLDRVRGALGYAHGGEVGKYFEGQVVGNGDGMSDQILFEVEGNNPDKALLSRDEYVIPADVVAMLGNGSSNAGSEQLDGFIKGIRQDAFGTQQQQKQLNAQQGLRGLV